MQVNKFDGIFKIFGHYEWLKKSLRNEASGPISIEIDLTSRCNYACPNCAWREINKNDAGLSYDEAIKLVRDCANSGLKAIVFSGGGEPLMHPALADAIKLAKELGLNIGLFTNGVLLEGDIVQTIVDNCDFMRINLGGVTPEIFSFCHGKNHSYFKRVKKNLINANALAKSRNSKIIIGIGSTINSDNYTDISKLADLACEVGCKYFQAKHDFELISNRYYFLWWESAVMPLLKELEFKYNSSPFAIDFTSTDYTRESVATHCYVHHLATAVNAEGNVAFCKRLRDREDLSIGNVKNHSIEEIYTSDLNRELSKRITPHNCGVICPYLELNDFIEKCVNTTHPNFF